MKAEYDAFGLVLDGLKAGIIDLLRLAGPIAVCRTIRGRGAAAINVVVGPGSRVADAEARGILDDQPCKEQASEFSRPTGSASIRAARA